jgi:hypothetical protein
VEVAKSNKVQAGLLERENDFNILFILGCED